MAASVGGTRKFYDTQVYNPADGALGHLDVSFSDCPTTAATSGAWAPLLIKAELRAARVTASFETLCFALMLHLADGAVLRQSYTRFAHPDTGIRCREGSNREGGPATEHGTGQLKSHLPAAYMATSGQSCQMMHPALSSLTSIVPAQTLAEHPLGVRLRPHLVHASAVFTAQKRTRLDCSTCDAGALNAAPAPSPPRAV